MIRAWLVAVALMLGCGNTTAVQSVPDGAGGAAIAGHAGTQGAASGGAGGSAEGSGGARGEGGRQAPGGQPGGGAGGAISPPDPACGGDIAGTWIVSSAQMIINGTIDSAALGLDCHAVPYSATVKANGTWSVSTSGQLAPYVDSTLTTGTNALTFGPSCLNVSGTATTCTWIATQLSTSGYTSPTCTTSAAGGCDCHAAVFQMGSIGTISNSPSTHGIGTLDSGGIFMFEGGVKVAYCVSGSAMTWTTANGQISFAKQ